MPFPVDWPGLATKVLALVSVVILARLTFVSPVTIKYRHVTKWYGYAAFILALPIRSFELAGHWEDNRVAEAGAAGIGFTPGLLPFHGCWPQFFPVSGLKRLWLSRRLLLVAGWSATAIVALIGPATCWSLFSKLLKGEIQAITV